MTSFNAKALIVPVTMSALIALTANAQDTAPHQSVLPDAPAEIILSNRDTNRVVCMSGKINGYRFSEEKGAIVDAAGNEAFIKFRIEQLGDQQNYVRVRSEFYFRCGDVTYTLLAKPQNTAAKTVFLVPGSGVHRESNIEAYAPLAMEERAVAVSLKVLKDDIPSNFTVKAFNSPYDPHLVPKLDVRLAREVEISGTGLVVRDYRLRARTHISLNEKDFLRPELGSSIYAVTLDRLTLKGGEVGRLVIVSLGG